MAILVKTEEFSVGARRVKLFLPEQAPQTILYIHADEEEVDGCAAAAGAGAAVACLSGVDWNGELSPWPAPRAFARGEDFRGEARKYLGELTETIVPAVEARLPQPPAVRGIAGYSLAGLFALFAAWESPLFTRAASMSGSLWYESFVDYLRVTKPQGGLERCYLSLGDRESASRNARLAAVGARTQETKALLEALGVPVTLVMQPGGHFNDVPARVEAGLLALL